MTSKAYSKALLWDKAPVVADYETAREFLVDYLNYLRENYPDFSRRSLAESLGMSPASLSMKLSGQRRLEHEVFVKIVRGLPMEESEKRAAEALSISGTTRGHAHAPMAPLFVVKDAAKRPDVFKYNDCRFFIKDYFLYLKLMDGSLSLGMLSEKTGIHKTTLSKLFNARKIPTAKEFERLLKIFDFTSKEEVYFRSIWLVGSDSDPKRRMQKFNDALQSAKKTGRGVESLSAHQFLSDWYYSAIRELLSVRGKMESEYWIQAHLKFDVSLAEIRSAVSFLVENGFIIVGEDDSVTVDDTPVRSEGGVYRLTLRHYHRKLLERAQEAIERFPREKRHYLANTLSVSPEDYGRVVAIMKEAQDKIAALGERPQDVSEVVQVVMNVYPLAEVKKAKKGGQK